MTPSSSGPTPLTAVRWSPPLEHHKYDRSCNLSSDEQEALAELAAGRYLWGNTKKAGSKRIQSRLSRLLAPLRDAMAVIDGKDSYKDEAMAALLRACHREKSAYWAWNRETWCRVLGTSQAEFFRENGQVSDGIPRQYMLAAAHLLGCPIDLSAMGNFSRFRLASKIFGPTAVTSAVATINSVLSGWGYARLGENTISSTVAELLLFNRSPHLEDLTPAFLERSRRQASVDRRGNIYAVGRALMELGISSSRLSVTSADATESEEKQVGPVEGDIHPHWQGWIQRWEGTSALARSTRREIRVALRSVGRWLQAHHPTVTSPAHWDRELCIAYVVAVARMLLYDCTGPRIDGKVRKRKPISAGTKKLLITYVRTFFRDCQEWGWIPVRFDPRRIFATPHTINVLVGPSPRTIAPDTWARLVRAGLNLSANDLPGRGTGQYYPTELLRALAVVWLFAGLRSDDICRLRLGCVRWQQDDVPIQETGGTPPSDAVCLLDVPANRRRAPFTKPVDRVVGEAIAVWEKVRPIQPAALDHKTGESVKFLFSYRAHPVPLHYISKNLILMLCRKAEVPPNDARGPITTDRARATIANHLFNAQEQLSVLELQAWLGHRSPVTTQDFVAVESTRLATSYVNAEYLARNVRAIEVLIDQDTAKSKAAAVGKPWRQYDLGHGLCNYEFFWRCLHRFACARCDFYKTRESDQAQLLEAKSYLLRLFQEVPMTDEERAAVDQDISAIDRIAARLAGQAVPSGET